MNQNDLYAIFAEEADDLTKKVERNLLHLEQNPADPETLHELFRCFHSIKGSAGIVGLNVLSGFAHHLEDLLEKVQEGQRDITPELVTTLLQANDAIRSLVAAGPNDAEALQPTLDQLVRAIQDTPNQRVPQSESPTFGEHPASKTDSTRRYSIRLAFRPNIFDFGHDPLLLLWELKELGDILSIHIDDSRLPPLAEMDPYSFYLRWEILFETSAPRRQLDEVFLFVADNNDIQINPVDFEQTESAPENRESIPYENTQHSPRQITAQAPAEKAQQSSIRVRTEKIERVMNLVEELAIQYSQATLHVKSLFAHNFPELDAQFDRVFQTMQLLQEEVTKVRMVSAETLFQRFTRVVRDLSQAEGKRVSLLFEGSDTELDKDVLEILTDPLKHIIRNAIDHGIETPAERERLGKNPQATLTLAAYQRGGRVYIEVQDDGRGIDSEVVREKAIELGWINPQDEYTENQLHQFLLRPGFSTKNEVTEISGRGVGLDVVQQSIQKINGTLQILSTKGQGTTIRLGIPLTLAIIDALVVKMSNQPWVIPIQAIERTLPIHSDQLYSIDRTKRVISYQNQYIPLYSLMDFFPAAGLTRDETPRLVLIMVGDRGHFGLSIQEILSERKVVVKNLAQNYKKIPGTAGATILEDGTIAYVLDPHTLTLFKSNRQTTLTHVEAS